MSTTQIIEPEPGAFRLPPIATAKQVEDFTGGQLSADDERVALLVDGASAAIRRHCGWHIAPVLEESLTVDGPGGSVLHLPTGRLRSLVEVTDAGAPIPVEGLDASAAGMIERRSGSWSSRFSGVTARVRHGHDVEAVADVSQIVLQVVANALSSPMGVTTETAGAMSVTWSMTGPNVAGGLSLLGRDLAVLDKYKI